MPNLQYIQLPDEQNPLADILGSFSKGAAYGLQKNFEQVKEHQLAQKDISALQDAFKAAKPGDFGSSLQSILTSKARPEAKKLALDALSTTETARLKQEEINVSKAKPPTLNKFSPLTPEIQQNINRFLTDPANQNLSDTDWYAKGVGKEYQIPPGEMDRLTKVRQNEKQGAAQNYENIQKIHLESKDFDTELSNRHRNAQKERVAINNIEDAVKSKKLGPESLPNLAQTHLKGTFLEHAFDSPESQQFQSALPQLLSGFESIFKRGLTDRDLKLILDKLPGIGKPDDANLAGLQYLRQILDLEDKKYQIGQEIKKENKGRRPLGYEDEIERRYEERYGNQAKQLFTNITGMVKMLDDKGNPIDVPVNRVNYVLENKGSLVK